MLDGLRYFVAFLLSEEEEESGRNEMKEQYVQVSPCPFKEARAQNDAYSPKSLLFKLLNPS